MGTAKFSLKGVIPKGDLVYRQYCPLSAPKHILKNYNFLLQMNTDRLYLSSALANTFADFFAEKISKIRISIQGAKSNLGVTSLSPVTCTACLSSFSQVDCSVMPVLLDLSAAFDTVNHELLLSRLSTRYGLCGSVLKWFTSYLTIVNDLINRTQFGDIYDTLKSTSSRSWGASRLGIGPFIHFSFCGYYSPS